MENLRDKIKERIKKLKEDTDNNTIEIVKRINEAVIMELEKLLK